MTNLAAGSLGLHGKTVIVTGAGRLRGIGHGICLRLAQEGVNVVVTDLVRSEADRTEFDACVEACAKDSVAVGYELDVTDPVAMQRVIADTLDRFGSLDGLVNNAGTPAGAGSITECPPASWQLSWDVNVMGMVHGIQAATPALIESSGAVVNTASIAGLGAVPGLSAYITTKYAVVGLTKAAAADLGPLGVRVNAVAPGMIETEMGDIEVEHESERRNLDPAVVRQELIADVAIGRWGQPNDIAEAVAWLLSPGSSYITGVVLPVTGGLAPGL